MVMDLHIPENAGIFMTEELLASHEGPCFMEFICYQVWKLFRIQTHEGTRQQSTGMGCQQLYRQILLHRNWQLSLYLLCGVATQTTVY